MAFLKRSGLFVVCFALLFSLMPGFRVQAKQDGHWRTRAEERWVSHELRKMTVEEKVGQLFIVHAYGKTPEDPAYAETNIEKGRGGTNFKEIIEKYHIGGVIYFNWSDNISTPVDAKQVQQLSNGLQKIALKQKPRIPLFISTDQEGGAVARVLEPGTVFPGNMALGATRSAANAKKAAEIMAVELKSLGINMDFAPDLDVNVNPANPVIGVRSYSENPNLVASLGTAQIAGFQSQNVAATGKHFPGHGDTNVDSHYGLPIIHHDLKTLNDVDLKPFKAAIASGVDAIMTAHIVVPALDDSGLPATLSKKIMTGLLREKLGYDGLIVTDSLDMSGANVFAPDKVPVAAFNAGADILLNPPDVEVAWNAVRNAVKTGEISRKRLDESVARILRVKYERGIVRNPFTSEKALRNFGTPEHLKAAQKMADESITLVKNENKILPLNKTKKIFVTGPSVANSSRLADLLKEKGFIIGNTSTTASPTQEETAVAVEKAQNADVIVAAAYNANTNTAQQAFLKALKKTGKPVVMVSMGNPYDIMSAPDVDANLLTYGNRSVSVQSAAKALTGEINPGGKLPVTIPGYEPFGHGLHY
ncbi:glycoside hydrolase family 3 protein [Weizmannia coagulans]|nr:MULTISPECIES: glycoside hydrolase family 3 protein [Heyndrickxia]MCR4445665.1 glycoside hydrolase family 3 protein [Heyndrickxia coagulans]MCW8781450.1 glycoside hydrolase family 3 protein [Heyndrickxia coagulans]MDL4846230.1 glycoside hydrolase family 3 protein [Heyndrickxia coagulans]UYT04434.1 glycoside hydrolase family 3 protein [Weizmannia sp. WK01]WGU27977.1 glycoside hydrolase family 3 protein [Heyndrickxia coagulans]